MKVYALPADAFGCGHYRVIWPADVLRSQGVDVTIIPPDGQSGFQVNVQTDHYGNETLTGARVPEDADVIVLQRPAHPLQPQLIRMMRQNGIAVVVDMDDDMSSIHPNNVAFNMYRTTSSTKLSWRNAAESCKAATLVTVSTPALRRIYGLHGRCMVLDNYVPERCLEYKKLETGRFGWAGTTASHPNDLQMTGRAIQDLIDAGYPFQVIGGKSKVQAVAKLRQPPAYTGGVGLDRWVRTIAESCDVGMVPLAPTAFNASKSRLKGIEYLAAGVPFVYSPREEYRRLNRESGCGLVAETPKQWFAQVKRLMDDHVLRQEQVDMGRTFMADQTYQAQSWRWAEAWTRAYEIERGNKPPETWRSSDIPQSASLS